MRESNEYRQSLKNESEKQIRESNEYQEGLKNNSKNMLCHPYNDTFACTGEAIKRDNVEVFFDGKYVTNKDGIPYSIFHQWDRTELAEQIRKKHESKLTFSI